MKKIEHQYTRTGLESSIYMSVSNESFYKYDFLKKDNDQLAV